MPLEGTVLLQCGRLGVLNADETVQVTVVPLKVLSRVLMASIIFSTTLALPLHVLMPFLRGIFGNFSLSFSARSLSRGQAE